LFGVNYVTYCVAAEIQHSLAYNALPPIVTMNLFLPQSPPVEKHLKTRNVWIDSGELSR
jgi:hypothetical protein